MAGAFLGDTVATLDVMNRVGYPALAGAVIAGMHSTAGRSTTRQLSPLGSDAFHALAVQQVPRDLTADPLVLRMIALSR